MAVDPNLITTDKLGEIKSIDFVNQFEKSIQNLLKVLGVTRKIPLASEQKLVTYKWSATLANGDIPEGETIPLSTASKDRDREFTVPFKKYRKATTAEAIRRVGKSQAIDETDLQLLRIAQSNVKADFFNFLTLEPTKNEATTLQQALARGWGEANNLFADYGSVPFVSFVNSMDVAEYVGNASISSGSSTDYGFTLLKDFVGAQNVLIFNDVPQGKVYTTASENIALAYQSMKGNDLASTFNLTTDETGLIGVYHSDPQVSTATVETGIFTGSKLFAEIPEGVIETSIIPGV